jgi:2-polyprenyl-6-methoxyphenol hydroxylase-like FAD-dependent oxidoreductase
MSSTSVTHSVRTLAEKLIMANRNQPQVSIIGAGLSGLVLSRCLTHRGITNTIYEKATAKPRHGYGITIEPSSYRPLLKYLDLDEATFRRRVAVDSSNGGVGRTTTNGAREGVEIAATGFRANRQKLETMLAEGVKIEWKRGFRKTNDTGPVALLFDVVDKVHVCSLLVGADGVHSGVRKHFMPDAELRVSPYAVYYGRRELSLETFAGKFAPMMNGSNAIERREGQMRMEIKIDDISDEAVRISYTYSRPARENDNAFHPNRRNEQTADFRDALFEDMQGIKNLEGAFQEVFDVEKMRNDRLLNWLMRSVSVGKAQLLGAAARGVVLIGDAAHAAPILGGYGANAAITDAIDLAEHIVAKKDLAMFSEHRYDAWSEYVKSSESKLANMHGVSKASL